MPLSTVFHIRLSVPKGFKFILAVSAQDIVILRFVSVLHLNSGRALERYTLLPPVGVFDGEHKAPALPAGIFEEALIKRCAAELLRKLAALAVGEHDFIRRRLRHCGFRGDFCNIFGVEAYRMHAGSEHGRGNDKNEHNRR